MGQTVLIILVVALVVVAVLGWRFLTLWSAGRRTDGAPAAQLAGAAEADAALARAELEAETVRRTAQSESESILRSAQAELESARRASASELESARLRAADVVDRAEQNARDLVVAARRESEQDAVARSTELDRRESATAVREHDLDARQDALGVRSADQDGREQSLIAAEARLAAEDEQLRRRAADLDESAASIEHDRAEFESARLAELERVASLSVDDARAELLAAVEVSARRDAAALVRSIESEARAEGTERARGIVVEAVQRVASEQTAETVVSVLHLPGDDMKGRIIGREGRNIRAFESVTGVNVIIDDTPEAVLLSCFDPVRREIGRITLEKLVLDGRIHPHRIEEVYELACAEVDERCLRAAHDALADVGITDISDALVPYLGRLRYRTSYGQNVLGHLVESAHIAGVMAAELGLEPAPVRRAAFLHDIGKALTHEVEGSHALIGAELLRRHGESEEIAHAVEAHHNEVAPHSVTAVLTQAADTCSASRPGARRESLETYVKRLQRIEEIARTKPGVERVFAMQSGREVRVMVQPNDVDDLAAGVIAREVAKQIEDELTYPGQIRVTVVREVRTSEIAH